MIKMKAIKSWFSRQVEEEMKDDIQFGERVGSIALAVFCVLSGLYFVAHQTWSTGFFTTTFGMLEMLLLYGFLIFWFVSSASLSIGRLNLSRNVDAFGGLFFATIGIAWLFLVFLFSLMCLSSVTHAADIFIGNDGTREGEDGTVLFQQNTSQTLSQNHQIF